MNEKGDYEWEREKLHPDSWCATPSPDQLNVVRRVYQQEALNKDADYETPNTPLKQRCKRFIHNCGFGDCLKNSVPIVRWLPKYNVQTDLVGDLVAGATTAVMHIPQGMAYALLSEVPPIVGLYMAFFPVLIYVVFGTSPHVSMGTFAVACLMAGKIVTQYTAAPEIGINNDTSVLTMISDPDLGVQDINLEMPYTPLEVLTAVTLTVGFFQVCMWILRLGAVSTLLSEPLVSGFTTGAAIYVFASQVKDLLGIKIPKTMGNYKIIITVIDVSQNLTNLNWAAFTISIISCTIIALNNELLKPWVSKRSRVPIPIELFAIVVGTLASKFGDLQGKFGLSLVGNIPTGLPAPTVPPLELVSELALDAFTITMVTYTISMSMALIFAAKAKYEIDANQELLALGASNIFGSFFACGPICASLSRSYIQYQAGSKTAVTSVISASLILCVLLWIGPFFEDLPRCVLASIIVVSLKGLFVQVKDLVRFWKLSKLDALVWLVTFLTVVLVNIDIGLGLGLIASVGTLFIRSQNPYTCLLGRVADTDLYLDIKRYRAAHELPGMKIFHYCGGLNFATKNLFRSTLHRKIGYLKPISTSPNLPENGHGGNILTRRNTYEMDPSVVHRVRCVIIDASAMSYVDAPGVKSLVSVHQELKQSKITVLLSGANGPMLEMIERYNLLEAERLIIETFPTVHDAVLYYNMLHTTSPPIIVERS